MLRIRSLTANPQRRKLLIIILAVSLFLFLFAMVFITGTVGRYLAIRETNRQALILLGDLPFVTQSPVDYGCYPAEMFGQDCSAITKNTVSAPPEKIKAYFDSAGAMQQKLQQNGWIKNYDISSDNEPGAEYKYLELDYYGGGYGAYCEFQYGVYDKSNAPTAGEPVAKGLYWLSCSPRGFLGRWLF